MKKIISQKEFFNKEKVVKSYIKYKEGDKFLKIIKSLNPFKKILSLGCGSGREVKALVERGHKVVAIDFAENMIKKSKKIEPRATYYCKDAVIFCEKNKDNMKFDYILGLFSFLNYIEKKDRRKLIDNLFKMLNDSGIIILEVRMINERWKDLIKTLVAPFYAFFLNRKWEFGDVYFKINKNYTYSHHFNKKQLKKLLRDYNFKMKNNVIIIKK